jgi:hypothetical protein
VFWYRNHLHISVTSEQIEPLHRDAIAWDSLNLSLATDLVDESEQEFERMVFVGNVRVGHDADLVERKAFVGENEERY